MARKKRGGRQPAPTNASDLSRALEAEDWDALDDIFGTVPVDRFRPEYVPTAGEQLAAMGILPRYHSRYTSRPDKPAYVPSPDPALEPKSRRDYGPKMYRLPNESYEDCRRRMEAIRQQRRAVILKSGFGGRNGARKYSPKRGC